MSKHRVTVVMPERPIEHAGVVFTVSDESGRLGELRVSQGGMRWLPKGKQNGSNLKIGWWKFIQWVEGEDA